MTNGTASFATKAPPQSSMITRMTLILDAFDSRASVLALTDVAARARLPVSSTYRILTQMEKANWIDHDDRGYRLGPRGLDCFVDNGPYSRRGSQEKIRAAAAEDLHRLYLHTGMVAHLAMWDSGNELFLDKIGGRFASVLPVRIGSRTPAHHTTGGRAMMAMMPADVVDRHMGDRLTRNASWDINSLHKELDKIRKHEGISYDAGDRSLRTTGHMLPSIAAPIVGTDGPVAAICLCADTTPSAIYDAGFTLATTAAKISRALVASPRS